MDIIKRCFSPNEIITRRRILVNEVLPIIFSLIRILLASAVMLAFFVPSLGINSILGANTIPYLILILLFIDLLKTSRDIGNYCWENLEITKQSPNPLRWNDSGFNKFHARGVLLGKIFALVSALSLVFLSFVPGLILASVFGLLCTAARCWAVKGNLDSIHEEKVPRLLWRLEKKNSGPNSKSPPIPQVKN